MPKPITAYKTPIGTYRRLLGRGVFVEDAQLSHAEEEHGGPIIPFYEPDGESTRIVLGASRHPVAQVNRCLTYKTSFVAVSRVESFKQIAFLRVASKRLVKALITR